eukprot:CCRYP_000971-RA/>CCRYP_000971-RA protein AED:0.46 eAED:0.62 QI:0/0/0/1/0/0/2/0/132
MVPSTNSIRQQNARPNSPRQQSSTRQKRYQTHSASRWQLPLLLSRHGHNDSRSPNRDIFLGSLPQPDKPILLNGIIHVLCTILSFVAASAAEAKLGVLFLNAKEAKVMRLTLEELGHPQPPMPIHVDNSTTV